MTSHSLYVVHRESLDDGTVLIVKARDLEALAWYVSRGWASPRPDAGFVATILSPEKKVVTFAYGRNVAEAINAVKAKRQ